MLLIGSLIVVGLLWRAGGEPLRAVTAPEVRDAPEPFSAERRTASTEEAARLQKAAKGRRGSFARPGGGPPEGRDAPEPFGAERRTASTEEAARLQKAAKVRIGSFERSEGVPEY